MWCGVVWCGVMWCGGVWCGVVWCGVVWCGVVWCGVVWCGVVWCGVVWCGVVWCGVLRCVSAIQWQHPAPPPKAGRGHHWPGPVLQANYGPHMAAQTVAKELKVADTTPHEVLTRELFAPKHKPTTAHNSLSRNMHVCGYAFKMGYRTKQQSAQTSSAQ